jgi:hypothetical protein
MSQGIVTVISKFEKHRDKRGIYIDTTSVSNPVYSQLSPFLIGPCSLYGGYCSRNMENAWQYSKVYKKYIDSNNDPTPEYFKWAENGWNLHRAIRYPMGKGSIPEYCWWDGKKLGYIDSRKTIYAPLYARLVVNTLAFKTLKEYLNKGEDVYLLDYDAYRHRDVGMTLSDVLNFPAKKMGHAFVLMMLLTNDVALKECNI